VKTNKFQKEEDKVNRILMSAMTYVEWLKQIVAKMEKKESKDG
jgi:hypothetical protein